jgi:hypothetical protein
MILVHYEADTIKYAAIDLSLICFLGTTEAVSSKYDPLFQYSNLSIYKQLM